MGSRGLGGAAAASASSRVPERYQFQTTECGVATLARILAYFGHELSTDRVPELDRVSQESMDPMHIAVIGKGLIGSAAARHLAEGGHRVTLIGPDEPEDFRNHPGVFAAHYDAARITRTLDRDPYWAAWAAASIARYPALEAATGLRFHQPVGFLAAACPGSDLLTAMEANARVFGVVAQQGAAHPFQLPTGSQTLFEAAPAGFIDPRRMVQAQTMAALAAGARVLRLPVWALREDGSEQRCILDDGSEVRADRVLVCAGAFSAPTGLVPGMPLSVNGRIVLLARLPPECVARWPSMPALILVDPRADLPDLYLLPPVRYPDGHHYIKIGTGSIDHPLDDLTALQEWYRYGGMGNDAERLRAALLALLPELAEAEMRTDACAITTTPSGHPIIDWVEPGRVAVACGGNGKAAKSADELGRLAALWVSETGSPDEFPEVLRASR